MECTFEQFKEKTRIHLLGHERWAMIEANKRRFVVRNKQVDSIINEMQLNEELTEELQRLFGIEGFAYRHQITRRKKVDDEYYYFVFRFHDTYQALKLTIRENGEPVKQDLLCKQLDDDWRETIEGTLPIPDELKNLSTYFISLVKHLPEYRLFYVTGMI